MAVFLGNGQCKSILLVREDQVTTDGPLMDVHLHRGITIALLVATMIDPVVTTEDMIGVEEIIMGEVGVIGETVIELLVPGEIVEHQVQEGDVEMILEAPLQNETRTPGVLQREAEKMTAVARPPEKDHRLKNCCLQRKIEVRAQKGEEKTVLAESRKVSTFVSLAWPVPSWQ